MPMTFGPVLGFRGTGDAGATWRVGVLVVTEGAGDPPTLTWRDGTTHEAPPPKSLQRFAGATVWRYDLDVPRTAAAKRVRYAVGDASADFHVPGTDAAASPLRLAYASCNGFSDPQAMARIADKNERWRHLGATHAAEPYHLLLLGGDQIYADSLWSAEPLFRDWSELPLDERRAAPFPPAMRRAARRFYFRTYVARWGQREVAHAMARIPTLMMWDDHDVFDGWGSHEREDQECPVFQGVFAAASEAFRAFQRMAARAESPAGTLPAQDGFAHAQRIEETAILALDLRSERTPGRIMSPRTWDAVVAWLDGLVADPPRHLLVMSSIPVVYPDLSGVESFLGFLPGKQELEDDLRDHWHSRPHKGERLRLIHRLLGASAAGSRVTILSGDVHVAAVGVIETERVPGLRPNAQVINQLTSSAIVHPPPPALVLFALENLVANVEQADRGITTELVEVPGTRRRLVGARNWLAVEGDDRGRLWCHWHAEGEEHPYTKVIHPVG